VEAVTIDFSGMSRHDGNFGRVLGRAGKLCGFTAMIRFEASVYLLLGAASRRFNGITAMARALRLNLATSHASENRTGILSLPVFPGSRHWLGFACTQYQCLKANA
jgi:hypothetical protein